MAAAILGYLVSVCCASGSPTKIGEDNSGTNAPLADYAKDGFISPEDYQRYYFNQHLLQELSNTNMLKKLVLQTNGAGQIVLVIPPTLLTNADMRSQIDMTYLARQHIEETNKGYPLKPSVAFEDDKAKFGSPQTTGKFFDNFLVRASYQDVTASDDQTLMKAADSFKAANPAIVSFARNYLSNSNQWILKGAILYPFSFSSNSFIHFMPSISFDREFNDVTKKDVNSIIFRVGAFGNYDTARLNNAFRLYADYATDFGFRTSIPAAELEYEPTIGLYGNGVFYDLLHHGDNSPILSVRYSGFIHQEYGTVLNAGGKTQLAGTTDFYRVGPAFKFALNPFFFNRLSLISTYEYLYGPVGNPEYSHDFKVQVNFNIDPQGHYTVNVSYEDGSTPIVKDSVQNFLFGLGVKF